MTENTKDTLWALVLLAFIGIVIYLVAYEAICSKKCGRHRSGYAITNCCCTREKL